MTYTFATVRIKTPPPLVRMPRSASPQPPSHRPEAAPEPAPVAPYGLTPVTRDDDAPAPTVARICHETAERYGVTVADLKSARRGERLVRARQEAMWRARHETSHSLPAIGRFLGGKDHTTVIYGIRKHDQRIAFVKSQAPGVG
jgi:hypothetical protein